MKPLLFQIKILRPLRLLPLLVSAIPAFTFAAPPIASTASSFFTVAPQTTRPASHTDAALNRMFNVGEGPYTAAMAGRIYPYPFPRNGTPGAPLLNGCYDEKNQRIGNLDANLSCTSTAAARPRSPVFRLFVGYKIDCGMTPATSGPLAGICTNTALTLNCVFDQQQTGAPPFNVTAPRRECSAGTGIIRRPRSNSEEVPGYYGCYPGQSGLNYPNCTKCPTGTFNSIVDENKFACTACSIANHPIANVATPPTTWITNVSDPEFGATSADQCIVDSGDGWTCQPGFTKDGTNQYCISDPPVCTLSLSLVPTNPTFGESDGKIVSTYLTPSGPVTDYELFSPTTMAGTGTGASRTFDGLAPGVYSIRATDSVCTAQAQITLTEGAAAAFSCPAGQQPNAAQTACAPCPSGTFKEFAGGFACSSCPAASIMNGVGITYSTQAPGAISPTACQVSYTCNAGLPDVSPATYTASGYSGATCTSTPAIPAPVSCDWGLYNDSGTLVTTDSTPMLSVGWAPGIRHREPIAAISEAKGICTSLASSSPYYVCSHRGYPATCQPVGAGGGRWASAPTTTQFNYSASKVMGVNSGTVTLLSSTGASLGTVNVPQVVVPTEGYQSIGPSIYLYRKVQAGGTTCVKSDGTMGALSTYNTQVFLLNCQACTGGVPPQSCSACVWADPGGVGAYTSAQLQTRCE